MEYAPFAHCAFLQWNIMSVRSLLPARNLLVCAALMGCNSLITEVAPYFYTWGLEAIPTSNSLAAAKSNGVTGVTLAFGVSAAVAHSVALDVIMNKRASRRM